MGMTVEEALQEMKHWLGVALESIDSKIGLMSEGMQAMEGRLDRKIETFRDELKGDIELTQGAVKMLANDVRSQGVNIKAVETKLDRVEKKLDRMDVRISRNERSIGELQQRVG